MTNIFVYDPAKIFSKYVTTRPKSKLRVFLDPLRREDSSFERQILLLLVRFASGGFYSTDILRAVMAEWSKAPVLDSIAYKIASSNQARGSYFFMCVACFFTFIFVFIYFRKQYFLHFGMIIEFQALDELIYMVLFLLKPQQICIYF